MQSPDKPALGAVWFSGLAALALLAALAVYLAPLRPGVLALQLTFTPGAFGAIIHAWSPDDLACYRTHLPVDGLLLLSYGAFGWLLATRTTVFSAWPVWGQRLAAGLMPLAAGMDAVENILHWWLTEMPRFGFETIYAASGAAALLKWLLLMAFAAAVALGLSFEHTPHPPRPFPPSPGRKGEP